MTVFLSILLLVNAAFNLVAWPRFYARVMNDVRARDENGMPTMFLRVHMALIGGALLLAAVSLVAGVLGLLLPAEG